MPISTFPGAITVNQSIWVGGASKSGTDQWLPYWTNGAVPMIELIRAAKADDKLDPEAALGTTVDHYVQYILAHTNKSSGWIGPFLNEPGDENGHGLWDPLNMLRTLLNYAQAHPEVEKRIATACVAHMSKEAQLLRSDPVYKWAQTRWPTYVEIALYIIDELVPKYGSDVAVMPLGSLATVEMLLNSSLLFEKKGMNWHDYYHRHGNVKFPLGSVVGWNTNDHGVNNAEGALRYPSVSYRLHNNSTIRGEMDYVLGMLDKYQGQAQSLFCADEVFCGREPNRGTETCAVVEAMASLEYAFETLGDPALMDRVERLAFNAMPGALTADMWTHVYVQQANSVFAGNTKPGRSAAPHTHGGGCACRSGASVSPNTPSGEDMGANFFGVSHFPCCITNFAQGWPKFAMHTILSELDGSGFVIASLVPTKATLSDIGATVTTSSHYPFGTSATITVVAKKAITAQIRIPGWAFNAIVNGERAANGTFTRVPCSVGQSTIVVELNTNVRIERGWGSDGVQAAPAVNYSAESAVVPTLARSDFTFAGGATFEPSNKQAHSFGIRSGDPHQNSTVTLVHAVAGGGHYISAVTLQFQYAAGYTPRSGKVAMGSTMALVASDFMSGSKIATLYQSPVLDKYSFDDFKGYSPDIKVNVTGLRIDNARPIVLELHIVNNDRNLELAFNVTKGLSVRVTWSSEKSRSPVVPIPHWLANPENAAVVLYGPLVFSLHPEEIATITETYNNDLPNRPRAVDYEIKTNETWAFALDLSAPPTFNTTSSAAWSTQIPFSTSEFPFSISVAARQIPSWGYWEGSKITDTPPASPVDCTTGACGQSTILRLVPFGGTNIRISVFPWFEQN